MKACALPAAAIAGAVALTAASAVAAPSRRAAPVKAQPPQLICPWIPNGNLAASDLIHIAGCRTAFKPKDDFEARPSEEALDGRSFNVSQPIEKIGAESELNSGWWEYDPDTQMLKIDISTSGWGETVFMADSGDSVFGPSWGFYVAKMSRRTASYVGSNAFGASAEVDVFHGVGVGLIAWGADWPGFGLQSSVPMTADHARGELPGARLVISGTLKTFKPNRVSMCGSKVFGATINTPVDSFEDDCVFAAIFSEIKVVSASGTTLASWLPPAGAAEEGAALSNAPAVSSPLTGTGPTLRPVVINPLWLAAPSANDVARFYPERAQRMGVSGRAEISCVVAAGRLSSCSVIAEEPIDQGFGSAALKLASLFRLAPNTKGGESVEDKSVVVPINFSLSK